uniref:BolA-like protein n=1 Tax=Panagrellus redivivus TaxID=6233 RepID=A0A7E4URP7_PANRE
MFKAVSTISRRLLSTAATLNEGEQKVLAKLKATFTSAPVIEAEDISGGCGTMYRIRVETADFAGKLKVQQHKLVTECLRDDIKKWHGVVIETKAV